MIPRNVLRIAPAALGLALFMTGSTTAWAAAAASPAMAPSKEMRAQMATVHEQMATCLRSDKPVADCHAEMMKACQSMPQMSGCRMGAGGMRMGKGMKGPMGAAPAAPAAPEGK